MASITISNLQPAGANLFGGSESFLNELTEQELDNVMGGKSFTFLWTALCATW